MKLTSKSKAGTLGSWSRKFPHGAFKYKGMKVYIVKRDVAK